MNSDSLLTLYNSQNKSNSILHTMSLPILIIVTLTFAIFLPYVSNILYESLTSSTSFTRTLIYLVNILLK